MAKTDRIHRADDIDLPDVSILAAAKYLSECSDQPLSNLQIQKMLYFAQMISIGQYNEAIFYDDFEAWENGPVNPGLYHVAKSCGGDRVTGLPASPYTKLPDRSTALIGAVLQGLKTLSPKQLVNATHWHMGAWAKRFKEGANQLIQKPLIHGEYLARKDQIGSLIGAS